MPQLTTDRDKIWFSSSDTTEYAIIAVQDSEVYTHTSGSATHTIQLPLDPGVFLDPVGIYSFDGGATWNDFDQNNDFGDGKDVSVWVAHGQNQTKDPKTEWFNLVVYVHTSVGTPFTVDYKLLFTDILGQITTYDTDGVMGEVSDTLFDSRRKSLNIHASGLSENPSNINLLDTIPHNLGYIPRARIVEESRDTTTGLLRWSQNPDNSSVGTAGDGESLAYLDDTNLYINHSQWNGGTGEAGAAYRYTIFHE